MALFLLARANRYLIAKHGLGRVFLCVIRSSCKFNYLYINTAFLSSHQIPDRGVDLHSSPAMKVNVMTPSPKLADILLVEDNEGDIELTKDAFEEAKMRNMLHIVDDGEKALDFLYKRNGYSDKPTPDIILLDLNLPKVDGREVLKTIKNDPDLKRIPTVILTSSHADKDILDSYNLHANSYIVKPVDAMKFMDVIQQLKSFYVEVVCLPSVAA